MILIDWLTRRVPLANKYYPDKNFPEKNFPEKNKQLVYIGNVRRGRLIERQGNEWVEKTFYLESVIKSNLSYTDDKLMLWDRPITIEEFQKLIKSEKFIKPKIVDPDLEVVIDSQDYLVKKVTSRHHPNFSDLSTPSWAFRYYPYLSYRLMRAGYQGAERLQSANRQQDYYYYQKDQDGNEFSLEKIANGLMIKYKGTLTFRNFHSNNAYYYANVDKNVSPIEDFLVSFVVWPDVFFTMINNKKNLTIKEIVESITKGK